MDDILTTNYPIHRFLLISTDIYGFFRSLCRGRRGEEGRTQGKGPKRAYNGIVINRVIL
jgi:hypothetical protein